MTYLIPSANSAHSLEVHSLVQSEASFLYRVTPPSIKQYMISINLHVLAFWLPVMVCHNRTFPYSISTINIKLFSSDWQFSTHLERF